MDKIKVKFTIISFMILGMITTHAQQNNALKFQIKYVLDSLQKQNKFPGATFSAVLPNGEQFTTATGLADSIHSNHMQPLHRMLSGSNGKTLFAAVVLKLASENKLKLDDKISIYLKDEEWFASLPNAESITIRMLLNHTSGLEEYLTLGDFMIKLKDRPFRTFTPLESLSYIWNRQPLFDAGTKWSYADTNFILVGYIIEKITGNKLYHLIQQTFLKPYHLNATEPSVKMMYNHLATGYARKNNPFPVEGPMVKANTMIINPQFEWAGGGFVSNVQDLAQWIMVYYNLPEISTEIKEEMRIKIAANTGKNHAYGLGVQIRPSTWGDTYGHSGWFPGYLTDAIYLPEIDLALAIQFNTDDLALLKMAPYDYLLLISKLINQHQNK